MLDNIAQLMKGTYTMNDIMQMDIPLLNSLVLARKRNNEEVKKLAKKLSNSNNSTGEERLDRFVDPNIDLDDLV